MAPEADKTIGVKIVLFPGSLSAKQGTGNVQEMSSVMSAGLVWRRAKNLYAGLCCARKTPVLVLEVKI